MDRIVDLFSLAGTENILVGLVFAAVALLVVGLAGILARGEGLTRRLGSVRSGGSQETVSLRVTDEMPTFLKFFEPIEDKLVPTDQEERSALGKRLQAAGYRHSKAPLIYYCIRFLLAIGLLPAVLIGLPLTGVSLPTDRLVLSAIALSGLGFYLPAVWVSWRIRKRQQMTREGLPDAIDMLLVCVEAGLSLAAALDRVGREIDRAHPVLGAELAEVSLALQAGKGREEALREMAERVGIPEMRSLVTMLIQTEALGVSVAQALRVHADDLRRKRFLRAEERANRLPVQMTLPLGLFILPTLMIVVLTPVIIRVIRILFPVVGN